MATKEINVEMVDIKKIKPYDKNVKIHTKAQVAKIAESITQFGWDVPIVVDKNYVIIKGHGRREAALFLKLKKVPVVVRSDLTDTEVKAARISDNRVAEGKIDTEMLKFEISDIDMDLSGIFDAKELDFMTADLSEMSTDSFIDVEEALSALDENPKKETSKDVHIFDVFGFKKVTKEEAKSLTRFIAILEEKYESESKEALLMFATKMIEEIK